jgi:ribosomal protein S27AE
VSRQIVAPNGKHRPRPRRPLLLPDTPIAPPADAARRAAVLDEDTLETLLDGGDVVANESAPCPACERTTFHAMHRDESRRCWTCGVTTLAGAA